jgi:hypothetical protein
MDKMPMVSLIFQSIPESIILFSFGLAIMGEYINFKKVFLAATISALASMLVRYIVIYFGLHTIIGIGVIFLLFWQVLKLDAWKSIIASLLSLTILILLETFIMQFVIDMNHTNLHDVLQYNYLRILVTYPHLSLYGLITWIIYNKKIYVIKGNRIINNEKIC